MTQPVVFCPYVGLASDRTLVRIGPDTAHRCFAQTPPGSPVQAHQATYCLGGGYATCPLFTTPQSPPLAAPPAPAPGPGVSRRWSVLAPVLVAAVLLIAVGIVYGRDLLAPPDAGLLATMPPASPAAGAQIPTATHAASTPKPTLRAEHTQGVAQLFSTPTAEPGGQVVTLQVKPGLGGWWTSGNARANHLGDSFLYSGFFDGEAFIAAVSIDLRTLPRGAPVREATLRLTGLQADRLRPAAGGAWSIQLLPASAFGAFERVDFQALYNASPAVSLFPVLYPEQLAPRTTNSWSLELAGREWLARQIDEGAGSVIIRVSGPTGGDGTLFAWDSGTGPITTGQGPQLIVSLGPVPATPPPLPTQVVAVASPTPANVLTAAVQAQTAIAVAQTIGTYTPVPVNVVTATPLPGNLATAQAQALRLGLPPIVAYTPKPANTATAAANSAYATAVAVTTGTFTPVPTDAITPIVIMPTVVPQNPATAAAQMLASTAQARKNGTPTTLAYGVLVATPTPAALIVESTSTPANLGTAVANAVNATAVALTTGTFTPVPRNAVTPTPPATGTPIPLLIPVTPPATATATPALPTHLPAQLAGKILFFSDRDGQTRLYALDPATGATLWVTQNWPFQVAQAAEGRAPDGNHTAYVENDNLGVPHIYVRDTAYQGALQITHGSTWTYDVAWSPPGNLLAFVSQEPGNDEIFTIAPDGSGPRRLTVNTWEWDKHPTWSPDGKQIAFWSNRETGRRQLWIMDVDGSNQRQLLNSAYNDWDPVWVK